MLSFKDLVYLLFTPNRVKKEKLLWIPGKNLYFHFWFFHDFCIAKSSSLLLILKLNVPTIKKMQRENLWKSFIFKNAIPMTGSYLEQEAQKQALRYFYETTCNEVFFSLFNEIAESQPTSLSEKWLLHRCFSRNFVKLLRTPILQNTTGRLLL